MEIKALPIEYAVQSSGLVLCRNRTGLIFFLVTEPPSVAKANPNAAPSAPSPKARVWTAVTAQEVEVHRDAPRSLAEAVVARPREVEARFTQVASDHEVSVVRDGLALAPTEAPDLSHLSPAQAAVARLNPRAAAALVGDAPNSSPARGTAPLTGAPVAGQPAQGGWFRKLFSNH